MRVGGGRVKKEHMTLKKSPGVSNHRVNDVKEVMPTSEGMKGVTES